METAQRKLTLEEIRAKTAESSTFEKAPTLDLKVGTEFFFRVKKVVAGKYKDQSGEPMDLVILSEVRIVRDNKVLSIEMPGYTQAGLQGPRTAATVKPGAESRLPNFVVKRFATQGIDLHPKYVYYANYIADKEVAAGTYKDTKVGAYGTDFPE